MNSDPDSSASAKKRLEEVRKQIQVVKSHLGSLEVQRKERMARYLRGGRKNREAHKQELDEVRQQQAAVRLRGAELEMECARLEADLGLAGSENLARARRSFRKLQSALRHDEWLVWTRSVWKFKDTESRAKTGRHPAQFSSVLPHRLIKMFSYVGETVLDPFAGMGTTLAEAWKLSRHSLGVDINPAYVQATQTRIDQDFQDGTSSANPGLEAEFRPVVMQGDARNLGQIPDASVQLIVTHPPYWNAVRISALPEDLSNCGNDSYEDFLSAMEKVLAEFGRVLEPERVAAVVIGDVMRKVHGEAQLFPLHVDLVNLARRVGFLLWDIYIWETKIRLSGGKPLLGSYPYPHKIFSQFAHNYVLVFRKR